MTDVTVVIGAGSIGVAIARRVSAGTPILLADEKEQEPGAGPVTLQASRRGPLPPPPASACSGVRRLNGHGGTAPCPTMRTCSMS